MKRYPLKVTLMLVGLLAATLFATGCGNTWRGAGKDVEKAGEKMQDK